MMLVIIFEQKFLFFLISFPDTISFLDIKLSGMFFYINFLSFDFDFVCALL